LHIVIGAPADGGPLRLSLGEMRMDKKTLEMIIDAIPILIVIENANYEVEFANKLVREMYGEGVLGKKCYQVFHDSDDPCPACPIREVLVEGKESFVYYPKHNEKTFRSHALTVELEPGKESVLEAIFDISETKSVEELQKMNQTLEEKNAELQKVNQELLRINKVMVKREFRIKELRDRVKELERQLESA